MDIMQGTILGSPVIPAIFAFIAMNLGVVSFIGCDFVRLNFAPFNDSEYLFPNDEWFGLGLFRMQDYSTNKSSLIWEHESTCYDYDDTTSNMFRSNTIEGASKIFIPSIILGAVALLSLLSSIYNSGNSKKAILAAFATSFVAAILQLVTFTKIFSGTSDDVCSTERYENWHETYPSVDYPNINFMRFFDRCTLGSTGRIAVAGFVFQFLTALFSGLNYKFAAPGDHTLVSAPTTPVNTYNVEKLKKAPLDVEEQEGNDDAGDDDLSFGQESTASSKQPMTPLRTAKSINAGGF